MAFFCWTKEYVHENTANKLVQHLGNKHPPPRSLCVLSTLQKIVHPVTWTALNLVPRCEIPFPSRFSSSLYLKCPGVLAAPVNQALSKLGKPAVQHISPRLQASQIPAFLKHKHRSWICYSPSWIIQRHLLAHLACSDTEAWDEIDAFWEYLS